MWRIAAIWMFLGCAATEAADKAKPSVAERRSRTQVICHRGAAEFAHENTLEAYRAALELGADGNEIDIRRTKDGVLICFHDDMLDRILNAYGDVADYTWAELQQASFRHPGKYADQCRIPTLAEAFELHKDWNGLMHLDIKRPGLDKQIAELLDRYEMWEHVIACHQAHGGVILKNRRLKLSAYKGGLYLDRGEVFPDAIAAVLAMPGDGVIVDDPRGVLVALGQTLGKVSTEPVERGEVVARPVGRKAEREFLPTLKDAADWNQVAIGEADQASLGRRITARAQAADALLSVEHLSPEAIELLEQRVRQRSMHKHWMYQGLDGEKALRTLLLSRAGQCIELAKFMLERDDPDLEAVQNPEFKNPRSWTDWRTKTIVFPTIADSSWTNAPQLQKTAAAKLCRDYLALTDDVAVKLGPPQFEQAGHALLAVEPTSKTAAELLQHRAQVVRGRAILDCLARHKESWAEAALKTHAPHALLYIVPD